MTAARGAQLAHGRLTGGHAARLLLLIMCLLGLGLGVRAASAFAATPVVNSWSLTPTGTNPNEPGSRPAFVYSLAPGASLKDSLTVWNYSNEQLTFHVYAADAFNTADDGFDLQAAESRPRDVGSWITIEQNFVTLPARSKVSLSFVVHVPASATPGDHAGGIVAASMTGASNQQGKRVVLDRRVGSRVYVRVNGPVTPALVLERLSTTYHAAVNPLGGRVDVTYTIRNNGNVRLGARQRVVVHDLFGKVGEQRPPALGELLPGNAVTVTTHFNDLSATVRVSATVTLTPFVPRDDPAVTAHGLTPISAGASTWAIPWTLLAALTVLAILIVYTRRRQRRIEPLEPESFEPREKVGVS